MLSPLKRTSLVLAGMAAYATIAACNSGTGDRDPVTIIDHGKVVSVHASDFHTCALYSSGDVRCWGENGEVTSSHLGLLGTGDAIDRGDQPGELGSSLPYVNIGVKTAALTGGGLNTCALSVLGSVRCWGTAGSKIITQTVPNAFLAYGAAIGDQPSDLGAALMSLNLNSGASVQNLAVGRVSACALRSDGTVLCWGENSQGQLGQGNTSTFTDSSQITALDLGGAPVTQLSINFLHGCALFGGSALGRVKCWGNNDASFGNVDPSLYSGALGTGDPGGRGDAAGEMGTNLPYVDLGTGVRATQVVTGAFFSCALLEGGSVKCWGIASAGQTGQQTLASSGWNSATLGSNLPAVDLGTGVVVTALTAGASHVCALLSDGRVKCWGSNANGQLGLGNIENRGDQMGEMGDALPAVDLGAGFIASQISAGLKHTCAVSTASQVKCWGENGSAQLGLGDLQDRGDEPGEMGTALPVVPLN